MSAACSSQEVEFCFFVAVGRAMAVPCKCCVVVALAVCAIAVELRETNAQRYCTRTAYRSQAYTAYRTQTSYNTYSCGTFGWSRCTATRYSRQAYTAYRQQSYSTCCSGYGDSSCHALCSGAALCPNGGICIAPNSCDCATGWTGTRCTTAVNCGTLTNPANGQVTHTGGTTFGQTATYSCNTGYNLVGGSSRTCQATRVWSGSAPTCQVVDCGTLTIPANGQVVQTAGTIFGRTATYSCNTGYNLVGSSNRICQATSMWSGSAPTCQDINECLSNNGGCDHNCHNSDGNYTCSCNNGYRLNSDGHTCEEVNECTEGTDRCQNNATCTNTAGSYICSCNPSFTGDGFSCTDINECLTNNGGCYHNCHNSVGSYSCSCNNGYQLSNNGYTCEDVDECAIGNHSCHDNATCHNNQGSYTCSCNIGFAGDGIFCTNVNECLNNNGGCQHNCRDSDTSYSCSCNNGYRLNSDGHTCEDINECLTNNGGCQHNCNDSYGSYSCSCNNGYRLNSDGHICEDINECLSNNGGCHHNCNDSDGSYFCFCNNGYRLNSDGHTCDDINECLNDNGGCHHNCNDSDGSYSCSCNNGYQLNSDGHACEDINECLINNGGCHHNCSGSDGNYTCSCNNGYRLNSDGHTCEESTDAIAGGMTAAVVVILLCIGGAVFAIVYIQRRKKCFRKSSGEDEVARTDEMEVRNEYIDTCAQVRGSEVTHQLYASVPKLIISSNSIRLLNVVGQGEFGVVYKAHLVKSMQRQPDIVAVKTLKGFFDQKTAADMMKESEKMQNFKHPHVLNIVGVCVDGGPAPYIIMPFIANGSLLAYIRKEKTNLVVPKDADDELATVACKRLADMCIQIAKGMEYLAEKKIVHRDLAARNCMIDTDFIIKVADFGLSESLYSKTYFRQVKDQVVKLPVKWLALEALTEGLFSEMSDVWSYGVTCWELFTGGKIPYPGVDPVSLSSLLESGHRLEKPKNAACSEEIYLFMSKCWHVDPNNRPTFSELVSSMSQTLASLADYMNVFAFGELEMEAQSKDLAGDTEVTEEKL